MLSWPSITPSRSLSRHRIIFWDVLFLIWSLTVCLWRSWLFQVQGLFRSGILSAISMSFTRVTLYSCTRSEHRSAQWSWLSLLKIRAGFFFFSSVYQLSGFHLGVGTSTASIFHYPGFIGQSTILSKDLPYHYPVIFNLVGGGKTAIAFQMVSQLSCPNHVSFPFSLEGWIFESQKPETDFFLCILFVIPSLRHLMKAC